jgi:hypothetical protein
VPELKPELVEVQKPPADVTVTPVMVATPVVSLVITGGSSKPRAFVADPTITKESASPSARVAVGEPVPLVDPRFALSTTPTRFIVKLLLEPKFSACVVEPRERMLVPSSSSALNEISVLPSIVVPVGAVQASVHVVPVVPVLAPPLTFPPVLPGVHVDLAVVVVAPLMYNEAWVVPAETYCGLRFFNNA